jgi:hypothetical protein
MAYAGDAEIAQDAAFMKWIGRLEKVLKEWGDKYGDGSPPYSLPLADGTGLECWHQMYEEGFTPQEAFDEDRSNWV